MPLTARVSPAAQRIIRDAFKDLERTISSDDSADFATTTLEKVIQAAHDVENQLAARQLLRNMRRLAPLFDGLHHYSKSIEAACNGTPYMPWIWAPIKIILKVWNINLNKNCKAVEFKADWTAARSRPITSMRLIESSERIVALQSLWLGSRFCIRHSTLTSSSNIRSPYFTLTFLDSIKRPTNSFAEPVRDVSHTRGDERFISKRIHRLEGFFHDILGSLRAPF